MTDPDKLSPASGQGYDTDGEVSLFEYLYVLLDEWKTLALVFALCMVAAGIYLIAVVPEYSASGIIQVATSDSSGTEAFLEIAAGRPSTVETEAEILKSRFVVGSAIQKLSLNMAEKVPEFTADLGISLGGRSPISRPLVQLRKVIQGLSVADWLEQPIQGNFTVLKDGAIQVQLAGQEKAAVVHPGGRFDSQGVSFSVAAGERPEPGTTVSVALLPTDMAVSNALNSLKVEAIGGGAKETNLVKVSFTSPDRTIARDVVNSIMETYMAFALDWKTLSADQSAEFIQKQLEKVNLSLEQTEIAIQRFVEENGAMLLPDQARELIQSGAELDLEMRKAQIQEDLLGAVASSMAFSGKKGAPPALSGDFLFDDELLGQAIGALNELEMKRATLLADVTESHPQVVKLREETERLRNQVRSLISASKGRIGDRRQALSRSLEGIREKLSAFPEKQRALAALERDQAVSQSMYTFLMTKLEESRIVKSSTTVDKRIIDRATTPYSHAAPKRKTSALIAIVIGLLAGAGMVFLRRTIDPRVRDEDEAKALSELPVYGAVPDLEMLGLLPSQEPAPRAIWEKPKGPAAEAFRSIRTNIEFAQVGEHPLSVIQVTSSEAAEGKSMIISNLAIALAKAGHRVILVDLDLRRPSQHRTFRVDRTPGISDHLVGQSDLLVRTVEGYGFDLIVSGNEPPESQRLLASKGLAALVERWRNEYDYVLLDTPPLLVADSLVVSRLSDMMLFVVRPRHCRRSNLKLAQATHERMDLVKGLIINAVSTRRSGYYHYYQGSYYGSRTSDTQET